MQELREETVMSDVYETAYINECAARFVHHGVGEALRITFMQYLRHPAHYDHMHERMKQGKRLRLRYRRAFGRMVTAW